VELSGADDAHLRGILDGRPLALPPGELGDLGASAAKADGELAATPADAAQAAAEGEPI
jgi:hypothetical protein